MKKKAIRSIGKSAAKRASGSDVGLFQAQLASAVVGIGAAVVTYRVLRSSS
jgi:hypothetical protein